MLDRIRAFKYGARPEASNLAENVAALPEMEATEIPNGDPVGAQGDKVSTQMTREHLANPPETPPEPS